MMRRALRSLAVVVAAGLIAGCASGRAFSRGEEAGRAGDWEAAVGFYRQALQNDPDRPDYKIALERAMVAAAGQYADRARQFENANQLEEALRAYRKALEFEPSNRQLASKAAEIERVLRDRIEAATPRPEIEKLREQARRPTEPVLNPTSREPLIFNFSNTSAREILEFVGRFTGINVTFDSAFADKQISVKLDGVTLEQALQQIMIANGFFYKVLNERTIIVALDTVPNRNKYEEQVIRTFYLSHADATEVFTMLNNVVRIAGQAVLPTFSANKTANTITVRATAAVVQIVERVIDSIDKPRAEVIVDVQILEVSRERAKQYGLSLTDYAIGAAFSPEVAPPTDGAATPFNLNTISNGVSAADFYMSVPSAVIKFLESDSQTKVLAKPQLRGSEGQKLTLNLGEDVPVPSTTFTPLAAGGATTNPLTSYGYRTIGIIVEMEPRVTYEGEVILTISVENSARGQDTNIAGQNLPSFFSRKVQTRLRLRDGESNLLAGLLREDERRSLRGFPGILRLPLVKQLFSDNDQNIRQTDIVMLLTPRIIRTHELRASDLAPIYIGTQGNLALGGPPPVFGGGAEAAPQAEPPAAAAAAAPAVPYPTPGAPGTAGTRPPIEPVLPTGATARPAVPAGASPIPGMTPVPPVTPTPAPNTLVSPPPPPEPVAATPPAAAPAAPPKPSAPIPGAARITLSPPGEMKVGAGPYLVPISVSGATRLSTVTIAVSYNPALVRVRNVQEGTFMRQGGVNATFTQQVDASSGRIDIAISRPGDQTGASTTGLLAALLLEPIAPGTSALSVSGSASMPGGASAALQFLPASITVR